MKRLIAIVALATCICQAADTVAKKPMEMLTPDERAARREKARQIIAQKQGGLLARPGTPKGEIFYVNCQNRAPKEWIDTSIDYFRKETKFKIGYREGAFDMSAPKIEGQATLFVIDDAKLPAILVAPENRWAFVNVAVIAKEERQAFFQARVKKQLSRVFAYLCGASNSQYPRCLTRGIVDEADLDRNPDHRLPVDVLARFRTYMETLGVKPEVSTTYRTACQQGWAPAPTNDVQKAIWEKVHQLPTKPIKILPETKKVKE